MGLAFWYVSNRLVPDYYQGVVEQGTLALNILLFLPPFLCLSLFHRDRQRKVTAQLWTHPFAPSISVVGKWLALSIVACLISWLMLLVGGLTLCLTLKLVLPLDPWLLLAALYPVRILLVTAATVLGLCLVPFPLPGGLLVSGLVVYHVFFSQYSMFDPLNLSAFTLYFSASIGTGPEGILLLAQSALLGGLALIAVALAILCFPLREPAVWANLTDRLIPLIGLGLCIAVVMPSFLSLQQARATYQSLGQNPVRPIAAHASQFQISVIIDPGTG